MIYATYVKSVIVSYYLNGEKIDRNINVADIKESTNVLSIAGTERLLRFLHAEQFDKESIISGELRSSLYVPAIKIEITVLKLVHSREMTFSESMGVGTKDKKII